MKLALLLTAFLSGCAAVARVHKSIVPECSTIAYKDSFGRTHIQECPKDL